MGGDFQLDIFGGEQFVTRKRNRPAPKVEAVQMSLFASDANEFAGQEVATDVLGELVDGEQAAAAVVDEIQAGDIVHHRGRAVDERITVARVYGTGGNRRIEGTNQNGQEVIRRADRYEVVDPDAALIAEVFRIHSDPTYLD